MLIRADVRTAVRVWTNSRDNRCTVASLDKLSRSPLSRSERNTSYLAWFVERTEPNESEANRRLHRKHSDFNLEAVERATKDGKNVADTKGIDTNAL